jgi:hypothetical protein
MLRPKTSSDVAAFDAWLEILRSPDHPLEPGDLPALEDLWARSRGGHHPGAFLPVLDDLLRRPEPSLRLAAARAAALLDGRAQGALPALLEALSVAQGEVRRALANAISWCDIGGQTPLELIQELWRDPDPAVRRSAVNVIARGDRRCDGTRAILTEALADPDATVRRAPLFYFARLRSEAAPFLPALEAARASARGEEERRVRKTVLEVRRWTHHPRRARARELLLLAAYLARSMAINPLIYVLALPIYLLSRLIPRRIRERFIPRSARGRRGSASDPPGEAGPPAPGGIKRNGGEPGDPDPPP